MSKYDPKDLFLDWYDYSVQSENENKSKDLPSMPLLESDEEEVEEGTGLKVLTVNKLLTWLPLLLSQKKAESNSSKLKN